MLTLTKETERIATQLRLFYFGPSWLGPSLRDLLLDVDEELARTRLISNAHSIWELTLHIAAWLRISRERMSATINLDPDELENWPAISGTWQDAIKSLEAEIYKLEQAILRLPEERLEEKAPAHEAQTYYVLLHGVIQHSAYHAGQIALLKKTAV